MRSAISALIGMAIWVVGAALIIASILALNIALPWKLLMGSIGILLTILLVRIDSLEKRLVDLLYFTRCIYIGVEYKRLTPEDNRPAKEILLADIQNEKETERIESEISGRRQISLALWLIYIAVLLIATAIIYQLIT